MSRLRAWGMAAALTAGAIAPTVVNAADSPTTTTDTRPFYKRIFSSQKPEQPGPVVRNSAVAAPPGQLPTSRTLPPDVVSAALQAEQTAYLRRLDACVKLQIIADSTGDVELMRQVEEIQRQVDALYKQRTAALGVSRNVRAPLPDVSNPMAASLDLAPEKPVMDPKAAAAKLVAPAAPVPVTGTANLVAPAAPVPANGAPALPQPPARDTIREVNP